MFLAAGGLPPLRLVLATLVGGTLAAGSANTLNCYLDRDIDVLMHRTDGRPLVTGEVTPARGAGLRRGARVVSTVWLAALVNWLAGGARARPRSCSTSSSTRWSSSAGPPQNIVWGGAAGCMPVLIGWAAVTGSLAWAPVVLFGVIFLWTPPHYWPLSMQFRDDYAAPACRCCPSSRRATEVVARRSSLYSWATVPASLLLVPVGAAGPVYAVSALAAGRLVRGRGAPAAAARAGRRGRSPRRCGCSTSRSPT